MIRLLLRLAWWLILLAVLATAGAALALRLGWHPPAGLPAPLPRALARLAAMLARPADPAALLRPLAIGLATGLAASLLGTIAALALWRRADHARPALAETLVPLAVLAIVAAAALPLALHPAAPWRAVLLAAHAGLAVPVAALMVLASLGRVDRGIVRAAAASGAPPFAVWRRIVLPLIRPGIAAAAAFGFAVGLGESLAAPLLAAPPGPAAPLALFLGLAVFALIALAAIRAAAEFLRGGA